MYSGTICSKPGFLDKSRKRPLACKLALGSAKATVLKQTINPEISKAVPALPNVETVISLVSMISLLSSAVNLDICHFLSLNRY